MYKEAWRKLRKNKLFHFEEFYASKTLVDNQFGWNILDSYLPKFEIPLNSKQELIYGS